MPIAAALPLSHLRAGSVLEMMPELSYIDIGAILEARIASPNCWISSYTFCLCEVLFLGQEERKKLTIAYSHIFECEHFDCKPNGITSVHLCM